MQPILSRDLCIRPFRKSDGPIFVAAALESVPTIGVWVTWCHERFALKDAQSWFGACDRNLKSGIAYDLGAFASDEKELLGGIAINQINRLLTSSACRAHAAAGLARFSSRHSVGAQASDSSRSSTLCSNVSERSSL